MSDPIPEITLYASPISDCSARIRIALRFKGLRFTEVSKSHSQTEGNIIDRRLNPAQTVPTLVIAYSGSSEPVILTQSIAALE